MSRKIFNYDNLNEFKILNDLNCKEELFKNSVSACGILFYKKTCNGVELLLISYGDPNWPKFDDFGGRVDTIDESIFDTMARELFEETNEVIEKKHVYDNISRNIYYTPNSKYCLLLVEVDEEFYSDTTVFGDFENADKIRRTISWHNYKTAKNNLAYRLTNNVDLLNFLDLENKKCKKSPNMQKLIDLNLNCSEYMCRVQDWIMHIDDCEGGSISK
jgi:ADP-ribose pyrophosphatase YjhB (NUDIX family)